MFRFRFDPIVRLRENQRDAARAALAEAYEALRQIENRQQELAEARSTLDRESALRRTGKLSVDRLLSDGRYERQLAAEVAQIAITAEKIEAELSRRQTALSEANASVRQMELLREREWAAYVLAQEKLAQANLDEIAGRAVRSVQHHRSMIASPFGEPNDHQEIQ